MGKMHTADLADIDILNVETLEFVIVAGIIVMLI